MDLLRENPSFNSPQFSASSAVVAASAAASTPFASKFLFGSSKVPVAYCDDAGFVLPSDYVANIQRVAGNFFQQEEEDDEEFLKETQEAGPVDLVVPFKKSVKQIARETTVVTTRRVLERLSIHYMSQRMAWKLLKEVPRSAFAKAERGLPTTIYIIRVSRTTFRGHSLGVAASWIVKVGIEIYRFFARLAKSEEETNKLEEVKVLGKKVTAVTIRCRASLVLASVGAGIGAALIRPSLSQWIGPIVVTLCLENFLQVEL